MQPHYAIKKEKFYTEKAYEQTHLKHDEMSNTTTIFSSSKKTWYVLVTA